MRISTKGRYALRMMLDLAQHDNGSYTPLRDISGRQDISAKYLEQIVVQLSRAGFVTAIRGAQGGYRLSRSPEEYTIGEILRVTEGSLAPVFCVEEETTECEHIANCLTVSFWRGLAQVIDRYVDSVTLADLLAQKPVLDYSI